MVWVPGPLRSTASGLVWPGGCRAARCRHLFERGHRGGFLPAHQVDDLFGLGAQLVAACRIQGGGRLGQHGVGVDLLAVDLELEVQVRTGGPAGLTDLADDLALLDLVTQAQLWA